MRTLRLLVILPGLLLMAPAAAAPAEGELHALFDEVAEVARARRRPAPDRADELSRRLAAVPREELDDSDWIDLHLLGAALERRLAPAPPDPASAREQANPPPANFPPAGLLVPRPDPVRLLDVAARCAELKPPAGSPPVPKGKRAPFAGAARRLFRLAREAAAFESEDLVADAAAAVLAEAARDLAFDLRCRSLGRAPAGRERFAWLLARRHGLDDSPEEVEAIGVEARRRILGEMEEVARRTDPDAGWKELTERARDDGPGSTGELLAFCERATEEALRTTIESGLVTVPEDARHAELALLDQVIPSFPTPYAMYRPRRLADGIFHGTFVVTAVPEELPESEQAAFLRGRDHAWMRIICGHEAVPGHHLQHARAARVASRWRHLGHTSVYVEGWGLYSEDLLDRAGAVDTPELRLALLRLRLWRAVRVIVDVGLHTGELRPSQAVRMLVEDVRMDRWTAEQEVTRYLTSPTQPLSYLIGYEKMKAIRRAWLARHGPGSERELHDRLLGLGPVPLDLAAAVLLRKRAAYDLSHP